MSLVMVYGTLKKGFCNNYLLETAEFISKCRTCSNKYLMYDLGQYPAIVKVKYSSYYINGELYAIDDETEKMVDELEGYPGYYDKSMVEVVDMEESVYLANIYHLEDDVKHFGIIYGGTWK